MFMSVTTYHMNKTDCKERSIPLNRCGVEFIYRFPKMRVIAGKTHTSDFNYTCTDK